MDNRLLLLESYECKRRNEAFWRMTQERLLARTNQLITERDIVLSNDNFLELIVEDYGDRLLVVPLYQIGIKGYCVPLLYLFGWGYLVARLDATFITKREDVSTTRVDVILEYQLDIIKAFMRAIG